MMVWNGEELEIDIVGLGVGVVADVDRNVAQCLAAVLVWLTRWRDGTGGRRALAHDPRIARIQPYQDT